LKGIRKPFQEDFFVVIAYFSLLIAHSFSILKKKKKKEGEIGFHLVYDR
jgi:hypothetical protein